ncbi:reverse transcriptase [Gossypium australe]|uniref:Reverse transcriptase n=1 Tax=Gossypium australe TaxID=47621 RepID=A0A5B6WNU9_9ROSI|nr:reverse transcriptase [Gossypium australe]
MNQMLLAWYTAKEVFATLKGMRPTKSARNYGFLMVFYQQFWHIIGPDVSMSLRPLNVTNIMLISKIVQPANLSNFKPIKCCIDEAQSAFVPGRLITNNVLLAYEVLHVYKQKRIRRKGLLELKLDVSKAFDLMLLKMGFANSWVEFIIHCISSISYSIIRRQFCPFRGLRQGNPLSTYLFLVRSEGLSSLMHLAKEERLGEKVRVSRKGPQISHLLFTDDCILFGEASLKGAQTFKRILKEYEEVPGQCVNYEKSTAFYSSNTTAQMRYLVSQVLNDRNSTNLERYLELPNMARQGKRLAFQLLKDRMKSRIDSRSTFIAMG